MKILSILAKNPSKKRNWTFLIVCYFTWNLKFVSNILSIIVVFITWKVKPGFIYCSNYQELICQQICWFLQYFLGKRRCSNSTINMVDQQEIFSEAGNKSIKMMSLGSAQNFFIVKSEPVSHISFGRNLVNCLRKRQIFDLNLK